MGLTLQQREAVIDTAVQMLKHRRTDRLVAILHERLERGDYPDTDERALDEIALAIVSAVKAELGPSEEEA